MLRDVGLRFRGRAKLCLALGLLAGWAGYVAAQGMAVPGKFEVQSTGAADYSIPIAVPPGTAGMTPSLSLSYNSLSRNGIVGMGWLVEGLPSISRCPRTFVQDGARGGVNYDASDRFCIDGQRLMAISGTYGADGTEYRTEIESFSKVISRGMAGTGPLWFEVRTKAGQRMEFGNSVDARDLAQGGATVRNWLVNKVSDTKGNYFTITYINDPTNGQVYPSRIDYTGNAAAGLAAYNSVRFVYDTARPDVVPVYHAGALIKTTVRLTNVQTYAGGTLVGDYRLAYQQGSATGRSQLKSVTLCDGAGACLPATTFGWQNGSITPTVVSNPGGQNGTLAGYRPYIADFNGDGVADIMWDSQPKPGSGQTDLRTTTGTRVLWTSTGGGNFAMDGNLAGQNGTLANYYALVGDFNRDGRADVLWSSFGTSTSLTQWLSTPSGGFDVYSSTVSAADPSGGGLFEPVDLNLDARTDLMQASGPWVGLRTTKADGSVGDPPTTINACGTANCSFRVFPADFNGDGTTDLIWLRTNSTEFDLRLNNGTGGLVYTSSATDSAMDGYSPYFIDVNGDGKADILWSKTTLRRLWIGKGDGNFDKQSNVSGQDGTLPVADYGPYAGDFNGDGLADILWVQHKTGARVLWQGKGDGTFTVVTNFGGQDGTLINYLPYLADFNGDGKTDILWDSPYSTSDTRSTGTRVLWLSDGTAADLMTSVTTGIGTSLSITYKPLTDPAVYVKDNTQLGDPYIHLQGPQHVAYRIDSSNGVGGTVGTRYAFAGARAHVDGRGFLGFRQMVATDLQTNIVQTTDFHQFFPFVGLVTSESKKLGAQTLSQVANSYQINNAGGGTLVSTPSLSSAPYQAWLTQSVAAGFDLDGAALPTITNTYKYDAFGNATQIVASASDGYTKTTTNTYSNDTSNWLLGRLTRASVSSVITLPCNVPWGGTVDHGQSVVAYASNLPPVGQSCASISQTRMCTNGTLSGSNTYQSCGPNACNLPWGGTISDGQSVVAYSASTPPPWQNCSTIAETRACTNGILSGSYAQKSCVSPPPPVEVSISANTNNLNLWDYLVTKGLATPNTPGAWIVTIAGGVKIHSTSTAQPALDTGVFPPGSLLKITNNGAILGTGGNGGDGGYCPGEGWPSASGRPGNAGGPALRARLALSITNNGSIWSGGGGGGGASARFGLGAYGGGGGGGAGSLIGKGGKGAISWDPSGNGKDGTYSTAGDGGAYFDSEAGYGPFGFKGGAPGLAGAGDPSLPEGFCMPGGAGGAPGHSIIGNSFVTWTVVGDRRGPLN